MVIRNVLIHVDLSRSAKLTITSPPRVPKRSFRAGWLQRDQERRKADKVREQRSVLLVAVPSALSLIQRQQERDCVSLTKYLVERVPLCSICSLAYLEEADEPEEVPEASATDEQESM